VPLSKLFFNRQEKQLYEYRRTFAENFMKETHIIITLMTVSNSCYAVPFAEPNFMTKKGLKTR
jgi:hypothetical protein